MMHAHEKSDSVIVAVKPTNKVEQPSAEQSAEALTAAESVEPRTETKGNADQQSTCRAPNRGNVTQALERIRQVCRHAPEVGAVCGKAARMALCGGRAVKRTSLPLRRASVRGGCCPYSRQKLAPRVAAKATALGRRVYLTGQSKSEEAEAPSVVSEAERVWAAAKDTNGLACWVPR